jgi:hypothetical protein
MLAAQFADNRTKEWERAARLEVHAHYRGVLRRVDDKRPRVGPRKDRPGKALVMVRMVGVVNPQRVIMEVDDQFKRPAWQISLSRVQRMSEYVQKRSTNLPDGFEGMWEE